MGLQNLVLIWAQTIHQKSGVKSVIWAKAKPLALDDDNIIAKGFEAQGQFIAAHKVQIASLQEKVARLERGNNRRAISNPNRRFIALSEALAQDEGIPEVVDGGLTIVVELDSEEEAESDVEMASTIQVGTVLEGRTQVSA